MLSTIGNALKAGLLFLSIAIINTSCNPTVFEGGGPYDQVFLDSIPVSKEAQRNFVHAWLADCVNEDTHRFEHSALKHFTDTATYRIQQAIANPAISGYFGKDSLVWGPVLSVSSIKHSGYKYTPDNLLYCSFRKDSSGRGHYMVGTSGTNAISTYAWLSEDLDVQSQQSWANGGKISNGTHTGMNNLMGFKVDGVSLDSFLRSQARINPQMSVEVSGHSLGGALTQTMASYLKGKLNAVDPTIPVSAWVYAGPTAGNDVFADSLVAQLDGYYAYHNTIDVVPHAWEMEELRELCSLYQGFTLCENTVDSNLWVNGVVRSLLARSAAGGAYTQPVSHVPPFTGEHYFSTDTAGCSVVLGGIKEAWKHSGLETGLKSNLNDLGTQCGHSAGITEPEFNQFLFFLTELGSQHVSAYYQHFLSETPVDSVLHKYVPGNSGTFIEWDALDALSSIVGNSAQYLSDHSISDCSCQASSGN